MSQRYDFFSNPPNKRTEKVAAASLFKSNSNSRGRPHASLARILPFFGISRALVGRKTVSAFGKTVSVFQKTVSVFPPPGIRWQAFGHPLGEDGAGLAGVRARETILKNTFTFHKEVWKAFVQRHSGRLRGAGARSQAFTEPSHHS